jgi:hypothetical protein
MSTYLQQGIRSSFAPRRMKSRMVMHGLATVAGIIGAWRFGFGAPLLLGILWYVAFFVLAHVACVPVIAGWYAVRDRTERWVRGIIEEELIGFDLRTYQRQLHRVFPHIRKAHGDDDDRDATA